MGNGLCPVPNMVQTECQSNFEKAMNCLLMEIYCINESGKKKC